MKIIFSIIVASIVIVGIAVGLLFVRWPTSGQVRDALGKTLRGNQEIAIALCGNPQAAGIVGRSFQEEYRANVPTSVPSASVTLLSPTRVIEKGQGTARIEGLAQSGAYLSGDSQLLAGAGSCSGTVSFEYAFGWDDNGVSRKWTCEISNVRVVRSTP